MPDFPTVLVTFARPEESRAFRRGLEGHRRIRAGRLRLDCGKVGPIEVVVAHTGIGPEAAEVALSVLLTDGSWTRVIAAGFAGGLDPKLQLGGVIVEERPSSGPPRLISRPRPVESIEEKARVFQETGAAAVDMETDTIAAACKAAGLPMTAVRAISDPAETALPVPFAVWFDPKHQRPKPVSLLGYLLRRPGLIPSFVRFVRSLNPVAEALAGVVVGVLEGRELQVDR